MVPKERRLIHETMLEAVQSSEGKYRSWFCSICLKLGVYFKLKQVLLSNVAKIAIPVNMILGFYME